jgi:HEAT repeat protein
MFWTTRGVGLVCLVLGCWLGLAGLAGADGAKPLSEADFLKLAELRLDDDMVVDMVAKRGLSFTPDEDALERLKKGGVSAAVRAAVRKAGASGQVVTYPDLLAMVKLGVEEGVILKRLEKSPTLFILDGRQEEELKQAGATEKILAFLRSKRDLSGQLPEVTDFAIILDCSGSMGDKTNAGTSKMEVAKKVVSDLIEKIPNGRNVTFIVYGHDAALRCRAVAVLRPLGPLDADGKSDLKKTIAHLRPVGNTPIALALKVAGEELAKGKGSGGIILLTDGMETCNGDPAAEAARLAANPRFTFGLNIVGFDVQDPKELEEVKKIVRAAKEKGRFYEAKSPEKLERDIAALGRAAEAGKAPPAVAEKGEEAEPEIDDPLVKALVGMLTDKDGAVRRKAAEGLGKMGARARPAVPHLVRRVCDDVWVGGPFDPDPYSGGKTAALDALEKLAPDKVTETLLAARKAKNDRVRAWAIAELSRRSEEKTARPAPKKDEEPAPPKKIEEPAPDIDDPVVKALVEDLRDKDGTVRRKAAEGLGKMGARARPAVPFLIKRVCDDVWVGGPFDPDPYSGGKTAALDALEKLAPEKVAQALLLARKATNDRVRAWAIEELARRSEEKTARPAPKKDEEPAPPKKIEEPQADIDDPVVKALVEDLRDKDGTVRRKAAEGLGKMGARARPAVPFLIKRVCDDVWVGGPFDPDPYSGGKTAALEALEKLAPDKVTETLLAARKAKNDRVKAWAIAELARRNEKK